MFRTSKSPAMIDRFYASHIKSVMEMGTEMVDSVKKKQLRYAEKKAKAASKTNEGGRHE